MSLPQSPSRFSPSFYREAGRACAHYVQNGGRLREINVDEINLSDFPLQLTPPPRGGRTVYPVRKELEEDLDSLYQQWFPYLKRKPGDGLRFLLSFCFEMEKHSSGWKNWLRVWLQQKDSSFRSGVSYEYHHLLTKPEDRQKAFAAYWEPHPEVDPVILNDMLEERITKSMGSLSQSQRAVVVESDLLGEFVIIKRYAANPKRWKRRWEHSRARRAWAAAKIMERIGMPAIQGLGWVEHYEKGRLQESYFISRQLPEMETLRTWLRREFPKMNCAARTLFRHRFRCEILKLKHYGLRHVDLKLSNLLVQGHEVEDLVFYWIDLEDLRAGTYSKRTFIRNLYQLNGSLPRSIPIKERQAFLAGFKQHFPFATSPGLFRFVQRKTLKRHRDELKRLQGA